jgi:hypothetical protein
MLTFIARGKRTSFLLPLGRQTFTIKSAIGNGSLQRDIKRAANTICSPVTPEAASLARRTSES